MSINLNDSKQTGVNSYKNFFIEKQTKAIPLPFTSSTFKSVDQNMANTVNNVTLAHSYPFSIFFINITSIRSKKLQLLEELSAFLPVNVICIAEHWCREEESLNIDDFEVAAKYCRSKKPGGGVCIFNSPNTTFSTFDLGDLIIESVFEVCAIKITSISNINLQSPMIIVSLYRTPKTDFNLFLIQLDSLLKRLTDTKYPFYVIGDFNVHMDKASCRENSLFSNLLLSYNLIVTLHTGITYYDGRGVGSRIDNCISNDLDCVAKICPSTLTNHRGILVNGKIFGKEKSCPLVRDFRVKNKKKFFSTMEKYNDSMHLVKSHRDCSTSTQNFQNTVYSIFNECFPRVQKSSKKHPCTRLSNKEIKDLRSAKWNAWSEFNATGIRKYKKIANKLNKKIKIRLNELKKDILAKSIDILPPAKRSKKVWDIIRKETSIKVNSAIDSILVNGQLITDPFNIAEEFNNYFANAGAIFSNQDTSTKMLSYLSNIPAVTSEFNISPISDFEITYMASQLNKNAATGLDKLSGKFIIQNLDLFVKNLVFLINDAINNGVFPDSLKLAKIVPICKNKKNSAQVLNNFRPISVLPFLSKFFEKVIYSQLLKYFEHNNLFTDCQYGFRKKKNTNDALINFINSLNTVDGTESIVSIQIDFSKAFDLVNHKLLLRKLKYYGIKGRAYLLIKSYLTGRKHLTEIKIGDCFFVSSFLECLLGVPQGSILGPLLFLIFINDLPATLKSLGLDISVVIYADDTNIIIRGKNILDAIFSIFNVLTSWCIANKISINFLKTCIINFTPHILYFDHLKFNDIIINVTSYNKYLGILVDNKLSWHDNIFAVGKKLNQLTYALRQLSKIVDQKAVLGFYFANFQSRLSYGIPIWGGSPKVHELLLAQKRALRIIAGKPHNYSCRGLFRELGLMTVYSLYIFELIMAAMKNGLLSVDNMNPSHSHFTRHIFHSSEPTNLRENKPTIKTSAIKLFNNLSNSLKLIFKNDGVLVFRRTLKAKLIEKPYYSLNEFFDDPI